MIRSFADRATADLFHRERTARLRRLPPEIRRTALRKLDMLEAACSLSDLRVPPSNRLESLAGDLAGFFSIRINRRWRLVFRFDGEDTWDVAILDYHR
ncbi:MAG: type II toxin-antitoxin system RelE/ParE family toxin [Planctomycetes bacterium]|nr:type II toxin-antitoxin system RelE/ParE family toxin [Planctomycetota bacterium]MBL7008016.1 type II toxin-antitoxin system RelE/ParE family toxin [Planctomycetota bacterium]